MQSGMKGRKARPTPGSGRLSRWNRGALAPKGAACGRGEGAPAPGEDASPACADAILPANPGCPPL